MPETHIKQTVAICDTQPITAEGLKNLVGCSPDLEFLETLNSLELAAEFVQAKSPDIVVLDKGFGMRAVLDWIHDRKALGTAPILMVWGVSMTEAEALRLLQAGASGIVRKTAELTSLLACLRTVASGRTWMEDSVFRDSLQTGHHPRSELTPREQQVLQLVEQGFKNKEIAVELGIRPGTVKIHLKHIFEKTGVRGRYGLALSGLKERGVVSIAS
jgi:two-component system, NarL family, nitrate/nitrite response regulator NarL